MKASRSCSPDQRARLEKTESALAQVTRRIGLSLGADICWPLCFEGILDDLDLAIRADQVFTIGTVEPVNGDAPRVVIEAMESQWRG